MWLIDRQYILYWFLRENRSSFEAVSVTFCNVANTSMCYILYVELLIHHMMQVFLSEDCQSFIQNLFLAGACLHLLKVLMVKSTTDFWPSWTGLCVERAKPKQSSPLLPKLIMIGQHCWYDDNYYPLHQKKIFKASLKYKTDICGSTITAELNDDLWMLSNTKILSSAGNSTRQ